MSTVLQVTINKQNKLENTEFFNRIVEFMSQFKPTTIENLEALDDRFILI